MTLKRALQINWNHALHFKDLYVKRGVCLFLFGDHTLTLPVNYGASWGFMLHFWYYSKAFCQHNVHDGYFIIFKPTKAKVIKFRVFFHLKLIINYKTKKNPPIKASSSYSSSFCLPFHIPNLNTLSHLKPSHLKRPMTLESIKFFSQGPYVESQDLSLPRLSASREDGTLAQGFLILKKPYSLNEEP